MTLIILIRSCNEAGPALWNPTVWQHTQTLCLYHFVLSFLSVSLKKSHITTYTNTHTHTHTHMQTHLGNTLTSPSEDCRRRSFLQYAVKSPTPALTSTPLGASRVRVRVGDSSLRTTRTLTHFRLQKQWTYTPADIYSAVWTDSYHYFRISNDLSVRNWTPLAAISQAAADHFILVKLIEQRGKSALADVMFSLE